MCPSISLRPMLVSARWNADAFSAASFAFRVSERVSSVVQKHLFGLTLAASLWKLDRMLADLLEKIYTGAETANANPAEPPTDESVRSSLATLRTLCATNEKLYNMAKTSGLTNRRFTGTALNSIRVRSEEFLDLVESIEMAMDDPRIDAIFDKALAELERGETVNISAL